MLWQALFFPQLALNALGHHASPSAVVSGGRVLVADASATAAGVLPGLKLSSALGLLPGLSVFERLPDREIAAMHQLACWAGRYSPQVSLVLPDTLLLELEGCLRLFGGIAAISSQIRADCEALGFVLTQATAPTPLAASWLAQGGMNGTVCASSDESHKALAELPLTACHWAPDVLKRLAGFGFSTLGDLFPLPRSALGQRIGGVYLQQLAQALGELPDPRPWFVFPEIFEQTLELPARVEEAERLVFASKRLLAALCGWLEARSSGISSLQLELLHDGRECTRLSLQMAGLTRDESRITRLLRERLGQSTLSAPVYGLTLRAEQVRVMEGQSASLFRERSGGAEEGALICLERLQARLGCTRVFSPGSCSDYRPELASQRVGIAELGKSVIQPIHATQPMCLLPEPLALREMAGKLWWEGPLDILQGPERVESGWWDEGEIKGGGDVRRDYFVAANSQGQTLWVFRDQTGWFLHGLFS